MEDKGGWLKVIGGLVGLATPIFLWGWSVEKRMTKVELGHNVSVRVERLEEALMPVLIEYKLNLELKKMYPGVIPFTPSTGTPYAPITPVPPNTGISPTQHKSMHDLRRESEDWAKKLLPPEAKKGS